MSAILSGIQLIVGLGNPGDKYIQTRHNAGAWFVEELAHANHIDLRPNAKCFGKHAVVELHGQSCHVFIPTTFMNHSGQAVRAISQYYKIPPNAILIAHDEIDLPAGIIRLKYEGGDGGHNGLKDIIHHLQTKQFYRLRIGVGRPTYGDVVDYVLHEPSKIERQDIDKTIALAQTTLPLLLTGQMQKAMQQLHTPPAIS
ncbi:MAG: aminoacyl-tRNA hydrolase [Gammaproteobacteria bacterium RIFCSPHIGHO2_12_FULL_41_20]|nr:MAG: aminoacyl-tRNA hydrolase [Gammaproteobacteria bacterium RIFCSPHIGHO2_12_FULL_41_20]